MAQTGIPLPAGVNADAFTTAGTGNRRQSMVVADQSADAGTLGINAGAQLGDVRSLNQSLTMTSGNTVAIAALNGHGLVAIQINGTWTGSITFEATVDGSTFVAVFAQQWGSTNQQQTLTTTINGAWHAVCAGAQSFRVRCSTTGTGTANVSLSATIGNGPGDGVGYWRPDGVPRVAVDPTSIFTDTFETLDQIDRWNLGGANAPTINAGSLNVSAGTTAGVSSYLFSKPMFSLSITAFEYLAMVMSIDAAVVTGTKRWWGLGLTPPTVTAAVPLQNGIVFETLDTDGLLYGAVYSGGVRTQSVALTRPADGGLHRYALYYKTSRVFFEIDNLQVGSIALPSPAVANLPLSIGAVNSGSPPGVAATLTSSVFGISDTGRNNTSISDPANPFRRATVKGPATAAVTTDTPLVVAIHPSSPMPGVSSFAGEVVTTSTTDDLMLTELQRMNTYLSILTGAHVPDEDIILENS